MVPYQADGCLDAISMASSRSAQSITSYPPTCSLVSANGPSLTSSSRSRIRTEVASLTSLSRWPWSSTPRPSISRNQSAYAGSPAGRGVAGSLQADSSTQWISMYLMRRPPSSIISATNAAGPHGQALQHDVQHHRGGGVGGAGGGFGGEGQVVAGTQPGSDDRPGPAVTGGREHDHGPVAGRADQPELVAAGGGQRVQRSGGEHQLAHGMGHHDRYRAAAAHRAGHHGGVRRGQHGGDLLTAGLGPAELVPHAAGAHPE